jgi:acyl carrier protein
VNNFSFQLSVVLEMAAVSATIVSAVCGSVAARQTAATKSVATFNGLRPCPVLRQRATFSRPVAPRRLTITAACDSETLSKVHKIIAEQLAITEDKVHPDSKFADLGADSLDTVEIMMAIEEKFDVSLEEDGAEKVSTVQEAADMIFEVVLEKTKA